MLKGDNMAEKTYEVIADKFVGKHRIYKKESIIPASEVMGGEEGLKLALEGQKDKKNKRGQALADVKPTLKPVKKESAKKADK